MDLSDNLAPLNMKSIYFQVKTK